MNLKRVLLAEDDRDIQVVARMALKMGGVEEVFVANSWGSNVTVIDTRSNSAVASIPVGSSPSSIAYASSNKCLYVANAGSNNVTVIGPISPPFYPVRFTESGLPAATNWSVSLNGTLRSSTTPTILFSETSGTYNYSVPAAGFFAAYADLGQVRVNDSELDHAVQFGFTALLQFEVRGLPSGDNWTVDVTNATVGVALRQILNGSGIGFLIFANVSYAYAVTFPPTYGAWNVIGNVTLPDTGTSILVSIPTGSGGGSLSLDTIVPIAVTIIATAVGATVVILARRSPPRPS